MPSCQKIPEDPGELGRDVDLPATQNLREPLVLGGRLILFLLSRCNCMFCVKGTILITTLPAAKNPRLQSLHQPAGAS